MAVDAAGNVFIADLNNKVEEVTAAGVASVVQTGSLTLNYPYAIAVDAAGDLYVADTENSRVVKIAAGGAANVLSTGNLTLSQPAGVAVDAAGDVYIADSMNSRIVEVSSTGTASVLQLSTINGAAMSDPVAVAVDATGDVFVSDMGQDLIPKVAQNQPRVEGFATTTVKGQTDAVDGPITVSIANIGNANLTFIAPSSGTNPNYGASFPENGNDANLCSSGQAVPMGASCDVSMNFVPQTGGSIANTVALTDNSLNASAPSYVEQQIAVSGSAYGSLMPQVGFSPSPNSQTYGTGLTAGTLDATANYNGTALAGTFAYSISNGTTAGTVGLGSILTQGTYEITAAFAPTDTVNYQPASSSAGYTVNLASATVSLSGLSQTFTGAPLHPMVTTVPANLVVALTYNGGTTAPTAPGSYAVTATINDPDYQSSPATGTLVIGLGSDTTTVTSSGGDINPGLGVTFTAQVASSTSVAPTGTVSFFDNGTLLGTSPLLGLAATYTTSTLSAGSTHAITATYSGDPNFLPSTSTATSVTVEPLTFVMGVQGASTASVAAGSAATYKVLVTPTFGSYPGAVSFRPHRSSNRSLGDVLACLDCGQWWTADGDRYDPDGGIHCHLGSDPSSNATGQESTIDTGSIAAPRRR